MSTDERPFNYWIVWEDKPALRAIYRAYYEEIRARCRPGQTREIGGGSGNLMNFMPAVISTDIVPAPWLDALADAQRLPFAAASFDNIAMFDVLHHLERPRMFFQETERVLRPGGRVVMVEPAITPLSGLFYRNFHPEPVIKSGDPLLDGPLDPMPDAFEANQATSRCSYSTSLAIWSGARYGEAMHTLGRRLACATGTDHVALPEQKDEAMVPSPARISTSSSKSKGWATRSRSRLTGSCRKTRVGKGWKWTLQDC